MPTPIANLGSITATGDVVTAVYVKIIRMGTPIATLTCPVAGAALVGVITLTTAVNKIRGGLPPAVIGSLCTGVNPVLGFPMASAIGVSVAIPIIR